MADITGKRFGRLIALGRTGVSTKNGGPEWRFRCDCGVVWEGPRKRVTSKDKKSCGCLRKEGRNATHRMTDTRLYKVYTNIVGRCKYKCSKAYPNYGGRGIRCEWNSFQDFFDDMGDSYEKHVALHGAQNTTIERINNDGNYSRDNCCWATRAEQGVNKRNNSFLEFNGKKQCVSVWAKELGFQPSIIYGRIKCKWPVDRILTTPIKKASFVR